MIKKINTCVIGLGSMGWGAACSLLREGFLVNGVDINKKTLAKFKSEGGNSFDTPQAGVQNADVVFIFVVNAAQTKAVLFGEYGAVSNAKEGTIFILCATMPPSASEQIAKRLIAANMQVIDAPVSGGSIKANAGEMAIMASGSDEAFKKAQPVLDAVAGKIFRLGNDAGMGSRVKMINQLLAGVHIAATAEAMVLGSKMGIDLQVLYDVIKDCAGNSWMFENRGAHIVNGDYTPHSAVDIFVKDLGIVTNEADDAGCVTPLSNAALSLFKEASSEGLGREDDAAVAKILAAKAQAKLPKV